TGNQADAVETVVEADHVALSVRKLMAARIEWKGTASELKEALEVYVLGPEGRQRAPKGWPADPHALSGRLRRAATALRKTGLEVGFSRTEAARTITIGPATAPTDEPGYKRGKSASDASPRHEPSKSRGLEMTRSLTQPLASKAASSDASRANPLKAPDNDGRDAHDAEFPTVLRDPSRPNKGKNGAADDGLDIPGFLVRGTPLAQETQRRLRLCGYSHERVSAMTPEEARAILGKFS